MKVFDLQCEAGHGFEGWFGSSQDFASQCERGLLACPQCGASDVLKAPMAPNLGRKGNQREAAPALPALSHEPSPPSQVPAPPPSQPMSTGVMPPEAVQMLHKLARDNRLMAEKLLKAEKENRKGEIVIAASREFGAHCAALSSRVGVSVNVAVSFADAIKGLKSLDSMRDKVSVALANAKIEANAIADRIEANIKSLEESSSQSWRFLFPDLQAVCTKASDDFAALLAARKASHATAESSRIEKIRAEEKAKADGTVMKKEKGALHHAQEKQSKRIWRQKHDKQVAPPANGSGG